MAIDLRGRTIIITGASSGIGAATARLCATSGMNVVLNARRADRLESVAGDVVSHGGQAAMVVGDVADEAVTARMLDVAGERFGRFDAVFANAGYGLDRAVHEMSATELREIFEVNFFASVHLVQVAAQRLIAAARPGHLLMCSSCLAKFTLPSYGAYSATKAAQNHICRAMRIELEHHGIHVSSVHPITTVTEFFEVAKTQSGKSAGAASVPDHTPGLFVQPPERVARAIIKCLRKPHAEVWTSTIVRATAAMMTLSPRFTDLIMRRAAGRDRGGTNHGGHGEPR